ncbi:MAG: carboxypeptidase regulatory-like domain-containing protein [Bacteroidetes bacterium]|nr:carboxypeptidase regulatory-like domain-containing protein [Bacteroidota bacterium]
MKITVTFLYIILLITNSSDLFSFNKKNPSVIQFISGKVVDERGFPIPYIKVITGKNETQTDIAGKFNFMNIPVNYDITIAERYSSTAVIYKELTVSNPNLVFFGEIEDNYSNFIKLKIRFPKLLSGETGYFKFISQDVFENKVSEAKEGDSIVNMSVKWPMYQNVLKGQVVYISKNDSGYRFIKFRQIILDKFKKSQEIKYDSKPGSKITTSKLNIYFPDDYYFSKDFSVSTDFFNYDKSSGIKFFEDESSDNQFRISVPDNLPMTFKLRITGYARRKDGTEFLNTSYASPGNNIKIESENPPELLTPQNNILSADGNTRFSYSSGSGAGIYVAEFRSKNPAMRFFIVTGRNEVYLNYLSRNEFGSGSIQFEWSVRKFTTYFNVDEFVKPPVFKNDFGYKAVTLSSRRYFKTGFY